MTNLLRYLFKRRRAVLVQAELKGGFHVWLESKSLFAWQKLPPGWRWD